jgi:hypothetical protein
MIPLRSEPMRFQLCSLLQKFCGGLICRQKLIDFFSKSVKFHFKVSYNSVPKVIIHTNFSQISQNGQSSNSQSSARRSQETQSFGVILLALDKRWPKQRNIKEMLDCYLDHRREVIFRPTQFRLQKAEARAQILEDSTIAPINLDDLGKLSANLLTVTPQKSNRWQKNAFPIARPMRFLNCDSTN